MTLNDINDRLEKAPDFLRMLINIDLRSIQEAFLKVSYSKIIFSQFSKLFQINFRILQNLSSSLQRGNLLRFFFRFLLRRFYFLTLLKVWWPLIQCHPIKIPLRVENLSEKYFFLRSTFSTLWHSFRCKEKRNEMDEKERNNRYELTKLINWF